jgi:predicted nuclease of predicted toxin-antitoxin system
MPRYLIDANLPYRFALWESPDYLHVHDLDDTWSDSQIWTYAESHRLTIVTKDADFASRVMLHAPPPRVIHIRLGNLKMRDFHEAIFSVWDEEGFARPFCALSERHRLVRVYADRIEGLF